ncbi:hypothetical protein HNP12_000223 [Aeromonas hydrophila]|uniref:hypothetical protein n=1 Tax=Aeromonas TaxID=642 RepID=UPI0021677C6C|nr:hypothetical protein [Aeromonas hydrophila]MCS3766184.1 hypothetical protein [Aeromonas hydrophila]
MTAIATCTKAVSTLHDLAVELYGASYLHDVDYKQFIVASGLYPAPAFATELVMQSEIDIFAVHKYAVFFCERILQNPHMRYSTSNGIVEYSAKHNCKTADEVGAVLLLSKTLTLTSKYSSFDSCIMSCLYVYQRYDLPSGKIPTKQAAEMLKQKVKEVITGIYNEYPVLEFETMMIDPA